MTEEYRLTPQRASEITALIVTKDPKITAIAEIIKKHVEKTHKFKKDPYYQKMESELEHINAILTGRRNLDELT
jgi:hypothetical protein